MANNKSRTRQGRDTTKNGWIALMTAGSRRSQWAAVKKKKRN